MSRSNQLSCGDYCETVFDDAATPEQQLKQVREFCLTLMELRREDSQRIDALAGKVKRLSKRKGG